MKSPAEYLADAKALVPQAEPNSHALLAIEFALYDAERYRTNLVGAVIRSLSPIPQPADVATPSND
jgi:hypothetical protein